MTQILDGTTVEAPTASSVDRDRGLYPLVFLCFAGILVSIPQQAAAPAFALAIVVLLLLALQDIRAVMILAYPTYALYGAMVSVLLIERGNYVSEQFRYGYDAGGTPLLAAYAVGFLGLAHMSICHLMRSLRLGQQFCLHPRLRRLIIAICCAVAVFYSLAFVAVGTGFSYPDLRFGWTRALPANFGLAHDLLASILIPIAFALAGYDVVTSRRARPMLLWLIVPIASMFLIGSKFSEFNTPVMLALMGAGMAGYAARRRISIKLRHILLVVVVVTLLFVSIMAGFRNLGNVDLYQAFVNRIVLQGHVWWGIYERFHGTPGVSVTRLISPNSLDSPSGLDYLSYLVSRSDFVYNRISLGYHFTMGGPPSALSVFGAFPGLLVYAALGALIGVLARAVVRSLCAARTVAATAGLVISIQYSYATQGGGWEHLYGKVALLCYVVLGFGALTARLRARNARALGGCQ